MAVSFVVLYCLVRGVIVQPATPYYLQPAENKVTSGIDLSGLDITAVRLSLHLYACLNGVGQIPEEALNPSSNINADRRFSFGPVEDINQNVFDFDNDNQNKYQDTSNSADSSLLTGYPPATPSTSPSRRLPALHTNKRNCHVIKCPKFVHATYGTDGSKCYEFANACFLAVASCKRHNNRLPRLKEVTKKQCNATYFY